MMSVEEKKVIYRIRKANLPTKLFNKYLEKAVKSKLIVNKNNNYEISDKGNKFLKLYENLASLLK